MLHTDILCVRDPARRRFSPQRRDDEGKRSYAVSRLKLDKLAPHEHASSEVIFDRSGIFTSYIERLERKRKNKRKAMVIRKKSKAIKQTKKNAPATKKQLPAGF